MTVAAAQVLAQLGEGVLWRVAGEVPTSEVRVDSPAVDEVPDNSNLILHLDFFVINVFIKSKVKLNEKYTHSWNLF